ncbi:hypothetical protein PCCS19_02210 [Paenibacillus sp. CCS19]|uniref:hypothetical protein n=1 Tax=Paenibacillus sp. CCS19 TaxID=3158387 RepID=UPI002568307A|nr:hypothetical protein [Paenibacillus cellulosilyticus]GMK37168.1 hypothetical protein PCCS19_02210 [Paenibacillus cellulosilyticus]
MAAGFYQFFLIPRVNQVVFTEEGIEFVGKGALLFDSIVNYFETQHHITNYSPSDKWSSFDDECYFSFDDGNNKFDLELNTGTKEERITEISVITSLFKPHGNILKTIEICSGICSQFDLIVWDMKLKRIIDFNDFQDTKEIINKFNSYHK